jgi:hypothetical protein
MVRQRAERMRQRGIEGQHRQPARSAFAKDSAHLGRQVAQTSPEHEGFKLIRRKKILGVQLRKPFLGVMDDLPKCVKVQHTGL